MHPPVVFDGYVCNGCNKCVEVCPMDIFLPNPEEHSPPLVAYPDECRYCGACWQRCPHRKKNALRIVVPPAMRVSILRGLGV
ncbi:MAG: ferredoxin family protein [Chloroflexota bacterium]|nr:ferredoxin family protein [Chloroflexota bacterium]